jgi:hypothetical protein
MKRIRIDVSKTERVFDFKIASYEEQFERVARQYLEPVEKNSTR